jgi:hypothetical protein
MNLVLVTEWRYPRWVHLLPQHCLSSPDYKALLEESASIWKNEAQPHMFALWPRKGSTQNTAHEAAVLESPKNVFVSQSLRVGPRS